MEEHERGLNVPQPVTYPALESSSSRPVRQVGTLGEARLGFPSFLCWGFYDPYWKAHAVSRKGTQTEWDEETIHYVFQGKVQGPVLLSPRLVNEGGKERDYFFPLL